MKYKYNIILFLIILFGSFIRLYRIDSIPNGLQQDELSIGYNAYSILKTGKDEHGKIMPLQFIAFGEYKLPVSIYATVPFIYIFGLNEIAVRLPFGIFGIATIIVFTLIIRDVFLENHNRNIAMIIGAFLLATNPWHIFFSRAAFEVTIALFFLSLCLLLLFFYLRKKQNIILYASIVSGMFAFYTYNTMRLIIPLLLISLLYTIRNNKKHVWMSIIIIFLFAIPFLVTISDSTSAVSGTLIHSSARIQAELIETRSYMVNIHPFIQKIFFSIPLQTVVVFIKNILNNINASFYLLHGPFHGNHGIGTHGLFFIYQLPLFLIGIVFYLKNKTIQTTLLLLVMFFTIIATAITRESPYGTRSFFMVPAILVITTIGVLHVWRWMVKRNVTMKCFIIGTVSFSILYEGTTYALSYAQRFPQAYAKEWRSADKALIAYLQEKNDEYDRIVIDPEANLLYISYLFYSKIDPNEFINSVEKEKPDNEGFINVKKFINVEYRSIHWEEDLKKKRTIFITRPEKKPETAQKFKTFYYPKRPVAIAKKQEIIQYPFQDIAYVVISSLE